MRQLLHTLQIACLCIVGLVIPWGISSMVLGSNLAKIVLLLALVFGILDAVMHGVRLKPLDTVQWRILLLYIWLLLTLIWSRNGNMTGYWTFSFLFVLLLTVTLRASISTQRDWMLIGVSYVLGCVIAAYFLYKNVREFGVVARLSLQTMNANNFSYGVVTGLPIAWALLLSRTISRRWLAGLLFAIYLGALLFVIAITSTISVFLAFSAWFGAVVIYMIVTKARGRFLLVGAILLTLVCAFFVTPKYTLHRLSSVTSFTQTTSWQDRTVLWKLAYDAFCDAPITGIGAGVFPMLTIAGIYAHDIYLSLLSQTGIIGLCLYFAAVWSLFAPILRLGRRHWAFWAGGKSLMIWLIIASFGVWEDAWPVWFAFAWMSMMPTLFPREEATPAPQRDVPRGAFSAPQLHGLTSPPDVSP